MPTNVNAVRSNSNDEWTERVPYRVSCTHTVVGNISLTHAFLFCSHHRWLAVFDSALAHAIVLLKSNIRTHSVSVVSRILLRTHRAWSTTMHFSLCRFCSLSLRRSFACNVCKNPIIPFNSPDRILCLPLCTRVCVKHLPNGEQKQWSE